MEAYTGRRLRKVTGISEYAKVEDVTEYTLKEYPVQGITTIEVDDVALAEDTDYWLEAEYGIIHFYNEVSGYLTVVYDAGYEDGSDYPIPDDLKQACIMLTAHLFTMRERIDLKSLSAGMETTTYINEMLPMVALILDWYRKTQV